MKVVKILIISLLLFSLILFINFLNNPFIEKEGLDTFLGSKSFCEVNAGYSLEKGCNKLTKYNCGITNCCAWVNDKCKAVNKDGLLF